MATIYKCPSCGAPLTYSAEKGKVTCDHCGMLITPEEVSVQEEIYKSPALDGNDQTEAFKHYNCSACGGEILTDEYTIATFCSFCGAPSLIENQVSGEKRPAMVIPFKYDKTKIIEIFRKWTRNGLLTPKSFTSANTIDKITGIYVPYWLYDTGVDVTMNARATKTRISRQGEMEHTHTDHYDIFRSIHARYEKVPVDASKQIEEQRMSYLEPFEYSELKNFEMPYLSGFRAEKYHFDSVQLWENVEEKVSQFAKGACRNTIQGYSMVNVTHQNSNAYNKKAEYVLLPVWILAYQYNGKQYNFMVNGQTGKLVGDLPISKKKIATWFFGIASIAFIIAFLIGGML